MNAQQANEFLSRLRELTDEYGVFLSWDNDGLQIQRKADCDLVANKILYEDDSYYAGNLIERSPQADGGVGITPVEGTKSPSESFWYGTKSDFLRALRGL